MIVYADRVEHVDTRAFLRGILAASDPLERLIRLGQLEAGVVDALCPERDDIDPAIEQLRCVTLGETEPGTLLDAPLPDTIAVRPPEGYAWYSLYPDQYVEAARRFANDCRPAECVVIGIRSIGTSLSAAVAHALPKVGLTFTVRPRGHPFDRRVAVTSRLATAIHDHAHAHFCIVDEGPGISGSSFIAVAEKLGELGIPDNRIVLFPSYEPNVEGLRSERARARWHRHPVYVEPFRSERYVPAGARDLSGGVWRDLTGSVVAANPQHERRKYLYEGKLWKFAGLAHLGREKFCRAQVLAEAGFTPPVLGFDNGFIVSEFCPAAPAATPPRMAEYLAFLRREFATEREPDLGALYGMIETNTGRKPPPPPTAPVVKLDGRMLPHEWAGARKTDALDHHDDHFFPGAQDIAWDIAGAEIECSLEPGAVAGRYLDIHPDPTLLERLPFYRVAYLAYRIGYATMSAESLAGTRDGEAFARLADRYRSAL